MGFQSYEMLAGDGATRERQKAAFIAGEVVNPAIDYPKLDIKELHEGIKRLEEVLSLADTQTDPDVRAAVWDSAAYRMAEMYWLLSTEELTRRLSRLSEQEIDLLSARVQELNEQLYGKPEKGITDSVIGEVWAQIDSKQLVGRAAEIKEELEHGTTVQAVGQQIKVDPLERIDDKRLPQIPRELLQALKEKLFADNSDIVNMVQNYWETVVQVRPDGERVFTPDDMFNIFKAAHHLRDPDNRSGIMVVMDPDARTLAWDTSQMAIIVGGRRPTISSPDTVLSKVVREYIVHGDRAIGGLKTSLPVLGTGLFTDADPGEVSDYLTFEEGIAGMCQLAVDGEDDDGWKPVDLEKTLATELAYQGRDFRQVYETLWRARVLMLTNDGQEISDKKIGTAQRNAYEATLRVFLGSPTDMPRHRADGTLRVLTFNKHLAYLKGKLEVIEFWRRYGDNPQMLDLAFRAKFDPLNKRQLAIVKKVFGVQ